MRHALGLGERRRRQSAMPDPVLVLEGLSKIFYKRGSRTPFLAVDDVSLAVPAGGCVALVGESGSGKTTLARLALRLETPDAGKVVFQGRDLTALSGSQLLKARLPMQPIFQDPGASFNPRRTVGVALEQALRHVVESATAREARGAQLLERVGLRPGLSYLPRYPHELSGGQKQRLAIARALAMNPVLIVADEPLSGADVSIRGQILNLLEDLRTERHVAYLLITHDISVARAFASQIAVMYHGQIVERGDSAMVLEHPSNDYTKRLLQSVPTLSGPLPSPAFGRPNSELEAVETGHALSDP